MPPENSDCSEGYEDSEDERHPTQIARPILQAKVSEGRTLSGGECLDEFNIEEAEFGELTHLMRDPSDEILEAAENQAMHDEPELIIARNAWYWDNKIRDKTSNEAPPFPEPDFQKYRDFSPNEMFELFISEDILEEIAKRFNQYALTKSGDLSGIKSSEIKVFWDTITFRKQ